MNGFILGQLFGILGAPGLNLLVGLGSLVASAMSVGIGSISLVIWGICNIFTTFPTAKELIANKDIHIEYYNKIFLEGDFDDTLSKIEFNKIIEFLEKTTVITYIGKDFTEIEKFLN